MREFIEIKTTEDAIRFLENTPMTQYTICRVGTIIEAQYMERVMFGDATERRISEGYEYLDVSVLSDYQEKFILSKVDELTKSCPASKDDMLELIFALEKELVTPAEKIAGVNYETGRMIIVAQFVLPAYDKYLTAEAIKGIVHEEENALLEKALKLLHDKQSNLSSMIPDHIKKAVEKAYPIKTIEDKPILH